MAATALGKAKHVMPATRGRRIAAAAALVVILSTGAASSCNGTGDGGSGGTGEQPPPEPQPPEEELPAGGPCPDAWPTLHEYAGTDTSVYPLDEDYRYLYDGFNICSTADDQEYVLFNNSEQVWFFAAEMPVNYAVQPDPGSESALFRNAYGSQQYTFVVPGEIVVPGQGWPDQISWAPEPALTTAWLAQSLALEHLEVSAESGNLQDGLAELIRDKQLHASNPVGAALLGCAKSGQEVASEAAGIDDTSEFVERFEVAVDGTKGASSCASSVRKLFKDDVQGSKDWLKHVNRASTTTGQGIDTVEALKPVLEYCKAGSRIPRVGKFLSWCP